MQPPTFGKRAPVYEEHGKPPPVYEERSQPRRSRAEMTNGKFIALTVGALLAGAVLASIVFKSPDRVSPQAQTQKTTAPVDTAAAATEACDSMTAATALANTAKIMGMGGFKFDTNASTKNTVRVIIRDDVWRGASFTGKQAVGFNIICGLVEKFSTTTVEFVSDQTNQKLGVYSKGVLHEVR